MNKYRTPNPYNPYVTFRPPPRDNNNNYLFTVELRSPSSSSPKNDVFFVEKTVVASLVEKTELHDVFPNGHVAARLKFRYWDDAAEAIETLWEKRLDGVHSYDPVLIRNDYCRMDELKDRILIVFSDRVRALMEGDLVRKFKAMTVDEVAEVSEKLTRRRGNDLSEFYRLCEKKDGLEAKRGMIEKRVGEFRRAMGCILRHLEGEGDDVVEGFDVFKLRTDCEWVRLDYLIKRECRRLEDGLPIYAFRREILGQVHNQQTFLP